MKSLRVGVASLLAVLGASVNASAASLEGRITAAAGLSHPPPLSVSVDAWACAPQGSLPDPSLRIGADRGLADVVVQLKSTKPGPPYPASGAPTIDQKACTFIPHVVVVAPGQDLTVKNSDAVLHNFHTLAKANRSLNQAQIKGKQDTFRFAKPEIIPVECDVHYWMSAVVVVPESAWTAVTGADGKFKIEGLEPGDYTAELWHQRLGTRSAPVQVGEGGGSLQLEWPAAPATSGP